nr:MAG TPA: hypothetical protein [Caudoviricetes sp.]
MFLFLCFVRGVCCVVKNLLFLPVRSTTKRRILIPSNLVVFVGFVVVGVDVEVFVCFNVVVQFFGCAICEVVGVGVHAVAKLGYLLPCGVGVENTIYGVVWCNICNNSIVRLTNNTSVACVCCVKLFLFKLIEF